MITFVKFDNGSYEIADNMRSEDKITKSGKEKNFRKLILKKI